MTSDSTADTVVQVLPTWTHLILTTTSVGYYNYDDYYEVLLVPIYWWGNRGPGGLNKVIELVTGKGMSHTQVIDFWDWLIIAPWLIAC